jgi:hypothetical protein
MDDDGDGDDSAGLEEVATAVFMALFINASTSNPFRLNLIFYPY